MRALSREEQALFDEMKERCLAKGQYKDEKAKDKFKMLCHLEDFMIQYWELKKQLTTYKILHRDCKVDNLKNISKIEEMENQQKDFINYLEDEIKRLKENDIYQPLQKMALATHEHILQKYKNIIGSDK